MVLDAAHNAASIAALVETLDESFSVGRRLLVFATTQEKDIRGMLQRLLGNFDHVIFTRYLNNPRGVPPEELYSLATLVGCVLARTRKPMQSRACKHAPYEPRANVEIALTPAEAWRPLGISSDRTT